MRNPVLRRRAVLAEFPQNPRVRAGRGTDSNYFVQPSLLWPPAGRNGHVRVCRNCKLNYIQFSERNIFFGCMLAHPTVLNQAATLIPLDQVILERPSNYVLTSQGNSWDFDDFLVAATIRASSRRGTSSAIASTGQA
jgi:hypothetical protein